jgi:hypothetical protein
LALASRPFARACAASPQERPRAGALTARTIPNFERRTGAPDVQGAHRPNGDRISE